PSSRIAVVGENGRGKSTLLHILSGALPPDEGQVSRFGTLGIAEQEMSTTDRRTVGQVVADAIADSLTALDELDAAGLALAEGEDGAEARFAIALEQAEALEAWDARRRVDIALEALDAESDHSRPLTQMSVGQRYRVRLACLLGGDADFLLLDEPTNHLDRAGLDYMTERLRSRRGGIVIGSHDRALLADIAETTIDLDPTPDGRPRVHGGGYAGYRAGRRAERERGEQEHGRQQEQRSKLEDALSAAPTRRVSGRRARRQRPASASRPRGPRRDHARTTADAQLPRPQRPTGGDSRQRRRHHRRRETARADHAGDPRADQAARHRPERGRQVHPAQRPRRRSTPNDRPSATLGRDSDRASATGIGAAGRPRCQRVLRFPPGCAHRRRRTAGFAGRRPLVPRAAPLHGARQTDRRAVHGTAQTAGSGIGPVRAAASAAARRADEPPVDLIGR